jgi:hypothetical protein
MKHGLNLELADALGVTLVIIAYKETLPDGPKRPCALSFVGRGAVTWFAGSEERAAEMRDAHPGAKWEDTFDTAYPNRRQKTTLESGLEIIIETMRTIAPPKGDSSSLKLPSTQEAVNRLTE